MITTFERIDLRPAAVGKLCREDEVQSLDEPCLAVFTFGGVPDRSEKIHFFRGRTIVERGDIMRRLARLILGCPLHAGVTRALGVTGVLGPASARRLVGKHHIGKLTGLGPGIPNTVHFGWQLEITATGSTN